MDLLVLECDCSVPAHAWGDKALMLANESGALAEMGCEVSEDWDPFEEVNTWTIRFPDTTSRNIVMHHLMPQFVSRALTALGFKNSTPDSVADMMKKARIW